MDNTIMSRQIASLKAPSRFTRERSQGRPPLDSYLKKFPIVAVVGARQTGKSTLVKDLLRMKRKYLTLDDTTNILLPEQDPESFLRQDFPLTIDEVQKVPVMKFKRFRRAPR